LKRRTRGCGCAVAVLLAVAVIAGIVFKKYVLPWWRTQPPPASGGELTVRILDVGPINGDSILISSPTGKTVLIDAGDTTTISSPRIRIRIILVARLKFSKQ
jgi:beta-lactamase superfamily II metal-dependent hydrolase